MTYLGEWVDNICRDWTELPGAHPMGWIVTRLRRRFLLMRAWMRYRRQRRRMIEENWETFYRKAEVNANERNAAERRIEAELDASYEVWKRSL